MKCSICGEQIKIVGSWALGNDAWPVIDDRCCDKCNQEVVIPARLKRIQEGNTDGTNTK